MLLPALWRPILFLQTFVVFSFSASQWRCAVDLLSAAILILTPVHGVEGLSGECGTERFSEGIC